MTDRFTIDTDKEIEIVEDKGNQHRRTSGIQFIFKKIGQFLLTILKLIESGIKVCFSFSFRRLALNGAGVDINQLEQVDSKEELSKFSALGTIVCITSAWAFIGANFFFDAILFPKSVAIAQENYQEWYLQVLQFFPVFALSALWGLMIFNIDRMFLSTMLGQIGTKRFMIGCVRLVLAAMLGYAISHPLKLRLFEGDISVYGNILLEIRIHEEEPELIEARKVALARLEAQEKKNRELEEKRAILEELDVLRMEFSLLQELTRAEEKGEEKIAHPIEDPPKSTFIIKILNPQSSIPIDSILYDLTGKSGCNPGSAGIREKITRGEFDVGTADGVKKLIDIWAESRKTKIYQITSCEFLNIIWKLHYDRITFLKNSLPKELQGPEAKKGVGRKLQQGLSDGKRLQTSYEKAESNLEQVTQIRNAERFVSRGYAYQTRLFWDIVEGRMPDTQRINDENLKVRIKEIDASSQTIWYLSLGLVIIFVFIECSPILVKLMTNMGPYELGVAMRLEELGHEVALRQANDREARGVGLDASNTLHKIDLKEQIAQKKLQAELALGIEGQLIQELEEDLEKASNHEERLKALNAYNELISLIRSTKNTSET